MHLMWRLRTKEEYSRIDDGVMNWDISELNGHQSTNLAAGALCNEAERLHTSDGEIALTSSSSCPCVIVDVDERRESSDDPRSTTTTTVDALTAMFPPSLTT